MTAVDTDGVSIGEERVAAETIVWAAGVQAAALSRNLGLETDRRGRVIVQPDLTVPGHKNVFVAGDQANFSHGVDGSLPGVAPVAMQQGRYVAKTIIGDLKGSEREDFEYLDKGQMATI